MNPYYQQQQRGMAQFTQQYPQQSFPPALGQVPNPFQAAQWPAGYMFPGYTYPFQTAPYSVQMPIQQPQNSQAATQIPASTAPPLPQSQPPTQTAPLPPLPDDSVKAPAPPPPEDEPVQHKSQTEPVGKIEQYNSRPILQQATETKQQPAYLQGNANKTDMGIVKTETNSNVNYKSAISSLAVSKQLASSNEDLSVLNSQLKQLESQMKKYQSEYEKWFKEFSAWRKQHENHPDQKQYIEYQQKYQKMIEQQQQALKEQYIELQNRIKLKQKDQKGPQRNFDYAPSLQAPAQNLQQNTSNIAQVSASMYQNTSVANAMHTAPGSTSTGQMQQQPLSVSHNTAAPNQFYPPSNSNMLNKQSHGQVNQGSRVDVNNIPHRQEPNLQNQQQMNEARQQHANAPVSHHGFAPQAQLNQYQSNQYDQQYQQYADSRQQGHYPNEQLDQQPPRHQAPSYQGQPDQPFRHESPLQQRPQTHPQMTGQGPYRPRFPGPSQIQEQGPHQIENQQRFRGQHQIRQQNLPQRSPYQARSQFRPQTDNRRQSLEEAKGALPRQGGPISQSPKGEMKGSQQYRLPFQPQRSQAGQESFYNSQQGHRPNAPYQMSSSQNESEKGIQTPSSTINRQVTPGSNIRPQGNLRSATKIPSLMSQDIPRKEYYEQESQIENSDFSAEKKDSKDKSENKRNLSVSSNEGLKTERKGSGNSQDFAEDDVSGFDDWSSKTNETEPLQQPPLSPKSTIQRKQQVEKSLNAPITSANKQGQIRPLLGSSVGRNVQQSLGAPRPSTPQRGTTPRASGNLQGSAHRPAMAPRQIGKPIRGPVANMTKSSSKPVINSAPPVEPPVDIEMKKDGDESLGHAAEHEMQNTSKQGYLQQSISPMQRTSLPAGQVKTFGPNQAKPLMGNRVMGNVVQQRDAPDGNFQAQNRLPSLIHQHPERSTDSKTSNCKFFPNCRFKSTCYYKHPLCPDAIYCEDTECIYDHPQLSKEEIDQIHQKLRSKGPRQSHTPIQAPRKLLDGNIDQAPNEETPQDYMDQRGFDHRRQDTSFEGPNKPQGSIEYYDQEYDNSYYKGPRESPVGLARPTPKGGDFGPPEDFRGDRSHDGEYVPYSDKGPPPADRQLERVPGQMPREMPPWEQQMADNNKNSDRTEFLPNDRILPDDSNRNPPTERAKRETDEDMSISSMETERTFRPGGEEMDKAPRPMHPPNQDFQRYPDDIPQFRDERGPADGESPWQRNRYPYDDRPADDRYERPGWGQEKSFEYEHDRDMRRYDYERPPPNDSFRGEPGRPPFRDEPVRPPYRDDPYKEDRERMPMRNEPSRYPPEDERPRIPPRDDNFIPRDEPGRGEPGGYRRDFDRSASPPHRREYDRGASPTRRREYERGSSPPRRESFREQVEFEKRYRDWEKQHFPIDDPTREWEFELRRRELLGEIRPPPRYAPGDYPPRDFPPYEREAYGRRHDPYDQRYRDDPRYPRDPFYDRGRDPIRPAVFDYEHNSKIGLYDVDPWKGLDDRKNTDNAERSGSPPPRISSPRAGSPRPPSAQRSSPRRRSSRSPSPGSKREERLRSPDRRRSSPSRRSGSPRTLRGRLSSPRRGRRSKSPRARSRSPRRRSRSPKRRSRSPRKRSRSPRRRSRSPRRRSRSPRRRSRSPRRSPSLRVGSRRSPSPRRTHSSSRDRFSPPRDRPRDSYDRAPERSFARDSKERSDPMYRDNGRTTEARMRTGVPMEDPYYSRYGDSKPAVEIKPMEPGPETIAVKDLLDPPGRNSRPKQIVIVLRGPPGCGKTHIAKIIKDKEVSYGSPAPRILALDDYFIQETDVYEKDPDTGKKVKVKKMEYVYEEEMEAAYRQSLLKSFNKTLDNGYFPMVIIDAVNDKVEHFQKFWSDGKHKGFEVYIAEMHGDSQDCAEKNIHNWTQERIQKILDHWEQTPNHFKRIDVRSLVQDAAIEEVEMEEVEAPVAVEDTKKGKDEEEEDVDEEDLGTFHIPKKSKWEETKDEQLAKLDGIRHDKNKRKTSVLGNRVDDDDDVYDDDPYDEREEDMRIGKKRVRWADIEERKQLEHRKRIGFCIGTDWSVLTDPNAQVPL